MKTFVKYETLKKQYLISKINTKKHIIAQHKLWINNLIKKGFTIKSGFLIDQDSNPGGGGLMIFEATNYEEALAIIHEDPMIKNNIVDWQIYEWKNIL